MVYGGAERYAVALSRLLTGLGFSVSWWQIGDGWQDQIIEGVPLQTIPETESQLQMFPRLTQAFNQQAAGFDYAIYFVTFLAYPQVLPHSLSISHGIFWDYPSFQSLLGSGPDRREWLQRMYIALSNPQRVVSCDTATINWARATWPGLDHQFAYIPNFVDLDRFHPSEEAETGAGGSSQDECTILFPRRVTAVRGINEFLRLAQSLTAAYDQLTCHVVGRAHQDEVERDLFEWSSRHERIYYYWKAPEAMPGVYQQADIAVIPSKASEGTSLACLEAMASGCAVVTTAVGGLPDLVIPEVNAVLAEPDAASLEAAVQRLVDDPVRRRELSAAARRTVQGFSMQRWRQRWTGLLEREGWLG